MKKENAHSNIAKVSDLLQAISREPCLQILLAIGDGEACVCHLVAVLGYRQAYISQHLMEMREAGFFETRRKGKYVFYRLAKTKIKELLQLAAQLASPDEPDLVWRDVSARERCSCSSCAGEIVIQELMI